MTEEAHPGFGQYASRVAGYIFNPLLVPPLALIAIVGHLSGDVLALHSVLIRSSLLFILFPALYLLWLKASGRITGLEIRNRNERFKPLLVGVGLALVSIPIITPVADSATSAVATYLSGLVLTVVAAAYVTSRFKMSLHVAAYAALTVTLFFLAVRISPDPDAVFVVRSHLVRNTLVIAAVTAAARARAGAHSWMEIGVGGLFGFGTGVLVMAAVESKFSLPFLQ